MRPRRGGWGYAVTGSDWSALADLYGDAPPIVEPVRAVVRAVAVSDVADTLVYATSMWDLIVTPAPGSPPPVDVVVVRGAMGMRHVAPDRVLVEHLPLVGIADSIERSASDAVRLFWHFVSQKYGMTETR